MAEYTVNWCIDLEADSAEEAARLARAYQLRHDAQVGHFVVVERDGPAVIVDLDKQGKKTSPADVKARPFASSLSNDP